MTERNSDRVLDTVEAFLDTHPDLEQVDLRFEERTTGENDTVRMMKVHIDGVQYLVMCKRGG